MGKESACNTGDTGSIPGLGRSHGGGHGSLLQYSCLENPIDRGAQQATGHKVAKGQTEQVSEHTHTLSSWFFSSFLLYRMESINITLSDYRWF